jgi:hypothetical protein
LLLVGGCFRDSGVPSTRCVVGESTCTCRDGDSPCDAGLVCDDNKICRSARCEDGREGCACVDGNLCLGDLQCIDQSCLRPGSTSDSGTPTTTGTTATSTATQPSTTAMPATTVDPDTGDVDVGPGTTTLPPDTDTGPMTSGPGTTGDPFCGCGWNAAPEWYDCGPDLPAESPDMMPPRACPDPMAIDGDPCGTVTITGCCIGDILVYCGASDTLVFDDCVIKDEMTCIPSASPA